MIPCTKIISIDSAFILNFLQSSHLFDSVIDALTQLFQSRLIRTEKKDGELPHLCSSGEKENSTLVEISVQVNSLMTRKALSGISLETWIYICLLRDTSLLFCIYHSCVHTIQFIIQEKSYYLTNLFHFIPDNKKKEDVSTIKPTSNNRTNKPYNHHHHDQQNQQ